VTYQCRVTHKGGPVVIDGSRVGTVELRQREEGFAFGYACIAWNGDELSWHPTLGEALAAIREHWA
jgi:hypothetical protein